MFILECFAELQYGEVVNFGQKVYATNFDRNNAVGGSVLSVIYTAPPSFHLTPVEFLREKQTASLRIFYARFTHFCVPKINKWLRAGLPIAELESVFLASPYGNLHDPHVASCVAGHLLPVFKDIQSP